MGLGSVFVDRILGWWLGIGLDGGGEDSCVVRSLADLWALYTAQHTTAGTTSWDGVRVRIRARVRCSVITGGHKGVLLGLGLGVGVREE